jgi:hypothetical protein
MGSRRHFQILSKAYKNISPKRPTVDLYTPRIDDRMGFEDGMGWKRVGLIGGSTGGVGKGSSEGGTEGGSESESDEAVAITDDGEAEFLTEQTSESESDPESHSEISESDSVIVPNFLEDGWRVESNSYLKGFAAGVEEVFEDVEHAKRLCLTLGSQVCGGVTCEDSSLKKCTVRDGEPEVFDEKREITLPEKGYEASVGEGDHSGSPTATPSSESNSPDQTPGEVAPEVEHLRTRPETIKDAWTQSIFPSEKGEVTLIPPGFRYLTNEKITHVNFADNCCAYDQNKSSVTSVEVGKLDVSFPKNGSHLSEEFKTKNEKLLNYHRHPALTRHKTPTAKKGYYVWKPYIFLQSLEEIENNDILVWSDAGVSFLKDIRPLIARYLRGSDVTGCRTVMVEADWSKRDAFVLIDMDYRSVI